MKRWIAAVAALVAACAWSNSLYQARTLSSQARDAERKDQPGQAVQLWGQVAVRAESAYARAPRGDRGAEALWLEGHARARISDCAGAVPPLRGALALSPHADWHEELLVELAECEEAIGDPTTGGAYAAVIAGARDPAILRAARIGEARALVGAQRWADALAVAQHDDTMPMRMVRGMALAQLGRGAEALGELEPVIATGDSTYRWMEYVQAFAAHDGAATDTLLNRLLALPNVPDELRSAWIFGAATSAVDADPARARAWLRLLATRPTGRSVTSGMFLAGELELREAPSAARLRTVADSLQAIAAHAEGYAEGLRLADLDHAAVRLLARTEPVRDGAPLGDLVMFGASEFARDSLGNPLVSAELLGRLERGWPGSPFVPKALLARAALEPDSSQVLVARARAHGDNPYILTAMGDVAGRIRFVALEDSLGAFVRDLWKGGGPATPASAIR